MASGPPPGVAAYGQPGQGAGPPQTAPGYGPGAGAPPPSRRGLSGGAVVALAAVFVLAIVATGVGVFLVAGSDDGGGDGSSRSSEASAGPATSASTASTPTTDSATTDSSTEGSSSTAVPSSPSIPEGTTPSIPEAPGAAPPPEEFPEPDGATSSVTGGIEVSGTPADVADFYETELTAAGYTVARTTVEGLAESLVVSGNGVDGQLVITDVGVSTAVLWLETP